LGRELHQLLVDVDDLERLAAHPQQLVPEPVERRGLRVVEHQFPQPVVLPVIKVEGHDLVDRHHPAVADGRRQKALMVGKRAGQAAPARRAGPRQKRPLGREPSDAFRLRLAGDHGRMHLGGRLRPGLGMDPGGHHELAGEVVGQRDLDRGGSPADEITGRDREAVDGLAKGQRRLGCGRARAGGGRGEQQA
jgi:hypothetical protein